MGNTSTVLVSKEDMMSEASQKSLTDPTDISKAPITFESLYKEGPGPVVFKFLRRFGCILCREGASDLTSLKPLLDEKYGKGVVDWIGIGLERLGYDEFKKGDYFKGKLYLDESRELYKALGFVELGKVESAAKLLTGGTLQKVSESKSKGFEGDLKGNKTQLGGVLVMSPTGEVLYYFRQENFGDEPMKEEVLKAIENYFVASRQDQPKL